MCMHGTWYTARWTWTSTVPVQQTRPTVSWAVLKEAQPAEWGKWLAPLLSTYWTTYRILHPFCCLPSVAQSAGSGRVTRMMRAGTLAIWEVERPRLVSLEKKWLKGHLTAAPSACGKDVEEMESGSSQWCMVGRQDTTETKIFQTGNDKKNFPPHEDNQVVEHADLRGSTVSSPAGRRGLQDLTGYSPEHLGLTSELILLVTESWTRDLLKSILT